MFLVKCQRHLWCKQSMKKLILWVSNYQIVMTLHFCIFLYFVFMLLKRKVVSFRLTLRTLLQTINYPTTSYCTIRVISNLMASNGNIYIVLICWISGRYFAIYCVVSFCDYMAICGRLFSSILLYNLLLLIL